MNSKLNFLLVFVLMLTLFFACNNPKEKETKFELSGTVDGVADGKLLLMIPSENGLKRDSAIIKEGKFLMKGDYPVTTPARITVQGTGSIGQIYLENSKMTLTGNAKQYKITGGKEQEYLNEYSAGIKVIQKKYLQLIEEYRKPDVTVESKAELKKEIQKEREKNRAEIESFKAKFIKENPLAYHSATLVSRQVSGKSAVETEKILNSLDPQLQKNPMIVSLKGKLSQMKEVEVGIDEMMANASNVSYKVDESFKGQDLKNIIYLAAFSNNNICALKKDGTVQILNPNGKELNSFKPELKGAPSSIAVDQANNIYIMCKLTKQVTKKVRGKSHKRMVYIGVECNMFTSKGEKINNFKLAGLKTATGARVVDNKLIVADYATRKIAMFDKKTGKEGSTIEDMRPCCGILDFAVNAKKEILVANLGAFRVQGFDFTGKNIVAFGQRGKSLDEFHGCCNPVSVNSLSNGAIVTVEKDPTRIKIYSKEGAKQIAGIEELVKGCSHIPMIVDAKDNLYLASGEKGLVKCVSIN